MIMQENKASRTHDDNYFFISFGDVEIERDSLGIYLRVDLGDGRTLRYSHGVIASHKIWIEDQEDDEVED